MVRAFLLAGAAAAGLGAAAHHRVPGHPGQHVVEISGMKFTPSALEVHRGDTITWINRDMVPHTATASQSPGFDTGTILSGDSAKVIAGDGGEYICRLHPVMVGKVVVVP
jgi:plastocyanin